MIEASDVIAEPASTSFTFTRVFDAPRELVFEACTRPEHLARWWGPRGFTLPVCEMDVRPGGDYRFVQRAPDGSLHPFKGVYREVVPPERIVMTQIYDVEPFASREAVVTLTLEDEDGKTRLTNVTRHRSVEDRDWHLRSGRQGMVETMDRLEELLDSMVADREIAATRLFDAPRELVWEAWTSPEHIARWWGPRGFTTTIQEMDVTPGGRWKLVMHGPDGRDYDNHSVFVEVARPERLVFEHLSAPRFRSSVSFVDEDGKTRVNVRMRFESAELRDKVAQTFGAVEGLHQNLDKLGEHLASMEGATGTAAREVVVTRVFDAPRQLVFDAWTTPEHLARWWGPHGFTLSQCRVDFRPGGAYRMSMRGPDGGDYPFHGEYREIVPPSRIVFTAVIEGLPGGDDEVLTTVTFGEENGKTRLTVRQTVPKDVFAARGQTQGWTESLEKLARSLE